MKKWQDVSTERISKHFLPRGDVESRTVPAESTTSISKHCSPNPIVVLA